jgi:hypothetical protein
LEYNHGMAGQKPGPDPKGGTRLPVRIPDDHRARYKQLAEAQGLSISDVIANAAARAEGLPEPYPARKPADTLPLELAA